MPLQLGLPVAVPPQYSCLKEVSVEAVRARLRLLYHFSDLMYSSWRLLNLSPNNQVGADPVTPPDPPVHNLVLCPLQSCTSHYNAGTWGIVQGQLRPLLAPRVYTLPMVRSIGKTMVQGKNYGPQITVKRISTRSERFRRKRKERVPLMIKAALSAGAASASPSSSRSLVRWSSSTPRTSACPPGPGR